MITLLHRSLSTWGKGLAAHTQHPKKLIFSALKTLDTMANEHDTAEVAAMKSNIESYLVINIRIAFNWI